MKKTIKRLVIFTFFLMCTTVALMQPAYAYLDPAATSYIVQIIAGVVVGCGVVVGVFWKKIRMFFKNRKLKRMEKKIQREAEKKEHA
ncbi:hypothetical protein LJB83_02790 [Clostridia bacterium OttesenSCG-928-F22]|nr:hypothetical protein [Clostridia bacterium OttesenSCG-928-F22]